MSLTRLGLALFVSLPLAAACASSQGPEGAEQATGSGGSTSASAGATGGGGTGTGAGGNSGTNDPLAQTPADDGGLTNVSADLGALLENGTLEGACDAYFGGQTDLPTKLRCGKWMYFYESFDTSGAPAAIIDFLVNKMPGTIGHGMTHLGMIEDPTSDKHLPLGLTPTVPLGGTIPAYSFTCASCHFGRLPDGRYAVGAPNHDYDYGLQNLALALFPQEALLGSQSADPDALARIQPMLDELNGTPGLKLELIGVLSGLLGASIPAFPAEAQHHYATWKPGTMDFLIAPLPLDDGVHTVSKISALWAIPSDDEVASSGMPHAMLGWTGGVHSVMNFLKEFVSFGGGVPANYPEEKLAPLEAYIATLRAPASPTPADAALVAKGLELFAEKGCTDCHDGPRGSGKKLYTYEEIGTDAAMAQWLDPTNSGEPCCNAPVEPGEKPTHAIKSPRLVGGWAMKRFLHNGSVDTLEDLFCVNGPRGTITELAYGDGGHDYTCDGLSPEDKTALIAYLRAR